MSLLNPVNDTALKTTRGVRRAMPSATAICKAWEEAKKQDPTLEFRTTFKQWRNSWLKSLRKGKRK
jgi:hypothetical protein